MKLAWIAIGVIVLLVLCAMLFANNMTTADLTLSTATPQITSVSVWGTPSVSALFINTVLDKFNSPSVGTGQDLYNDGVAVGIDPAFALALFRHESVYGTLGVATGNLSLGNIRCEPAFPCHDGFARYPTWEAGYADFYSLIRSYAKRGLKTVEQIIPVYAPAPENDVRGYENAVIYAMQKFSAGVVV